MAYSFVEIERQKTNTIKWVLVFLFFFYIFSFLAIYISAKNWFIAYSAYKYGEHFYWQWFSRQEFIVGLTASIFVIIWQWQVATSQLLERFIGVLGAEPPNKNDSYHKVLINIVEEVSVATGGVKMEPYVIPIMAMNAFAISDFQGRSIIGVTEGLLARLTRQQLEAVVAHEAAHIASGDSLQTTVISSLFEVYNALISGIESTTGGSRISTRSRDNSFSGLVVIVYMILVLSRSMALLMKMFISREREYRADAIAVRLTRDPISLAEALYSITYHWKLQGMPSAEMDSIFTVSPNLTPDQEGNGFMDELFRTHPPALDRIKVLLNMAHEDLQTLVNDVDAKSERIRVEVPQLSGTTDNTQWMVSKNNLWEGPYNLTQIAGLSWFNPETWVKRMDQEGVKLAYDDQELIGFLKQQHQNASGLFCCPKCKIGLQELEYEGVLVYKCPTCSGTLVNERDVQRIIIRPEVGFNDRIKKIGDELDKNTARWSEAKINRNLITLYTCPKCMNDRCKMNRMFYTAVYQVEIDKCFYCGMIWFDKDELEVLQYLIEKRSLTAYDKNY
ncbi:MAG: M48 family metalloprotease [Candidatus Omnitrophica bacterium]|nr:M48 family metalloprotease [Candidatus Omnitrophota bacterium]